MSGMSDAGMGVPQAPDPRRRVRTPSADVERELVAAAEAVLVRDGPAGLTVRAVAAEAGIAPMGVYSRLGGKDGLVDALLIRGFDRLRVAVGSPAEPDLLQRLLSSGRGYRQFALANPNFYAIMFENAIPREELTDVVMEHAAAAFGAIVRIVELVAASGAIVAPDATEVAQQLWSAVHGAVALELKGLIQTPDPAATFEASLLSLLRGLAADPAAVPRRQLAAGSLPEGFAGDHGGSGGMMLGGSAE